MEIVSGETTRKKKGPSRQFGSSSGADALILNPNSQPACMSTLASVYHVLLKYGAGELMTRTESYAMARSSTHELSTDQWESLAAERKGDHRLVLLRHSALKAYCTVEKGIAASDVKKLVSSEEEKKMLQGLRASG